MLDTGATSHQEQLPRLDVAHKHTHTRTCPHTHTDMHTHEAQIHTRNHTCTHTHACTHRHTHAEHPQMHAHVYMCTHTQRTPTCRTPTRTPTLCPATTPRPHYRKKPQAAELRTHPESTLAHQPGPAKDLGPQLPARAEVGRGRPPGRPGAL